MLVGSVAVLRPDLFGAIVPLVGVHDLLRFHLFGQGAGWQAGIGYVNDPADFRALLATSPLHNVRAGDRGIRRCCSSPAITTSGWRRCTRTSLRPRCRPRRQVPPGAAARLCRLWTFRGSSLSQRIEQRGEYPLFFAHALGLPLP